MKKTVTIIMVLMLAVLAALPAYTNGQRVISVDSGVYKAMETLYILAGKRLPSSSGPWTEDEMTIMLERISRDSLSDAARKLYDQIESMVVSEPKTVYDDNFASSFNLDAALEAYIHTDTANVRDENLWFHGFTSRRPFLNLSCETWPGNSFYGYFELTLGHNYGYDVGSANNALYGNAFNINIPLLNAMWFSKPSNGNNFADFDWTFPYKALVSAGGSNWNIMAGRDRLSWGSGETGNLMLSQSFPKQTFMKATTYHNAFKYSLLFAFYPGIDSDASNQFASLDGWKALVTHRLEFNLLWDKVGLVINEACMFWSTKDQQFSLFQINPFGFMHNEYVARNANSLLVFELNYTPVNGVNLYAQAAVDEFSGPGEGRVNPSAFGILAGAKGAMSAGTGILYGSLEFARTDPFLYIRGQHYEYTDPDKASGYGYDAKLRIISCDRMTVQSKFVTYTYGNDTILFDGKINYAVPSSWKIGFEMMYMMHGSMSSTSRWGQYEGSYSNAPDVTTPTTFNPFDPEDYDVATDTILRTHGVEKSTILSLSGEYNILQSLAVYGVVDWLFVDNVANTKGKNLKDFQVTLGVSYSL